MSEFRIDQIKSQDASRGPDVAGITTFTGTSGIVMPSGDTAHRGGRGRGVFCGGYNPTAYNIMDYVTIATLGNAIDFGDLTTSVRLAAGNGSSTRGIVSGGVIKEEIQYTTISSTGNTLDFGSISWGASYGLMSAGNSTRNLIMGGFNPTLGDVTTIDFITFSTLGNSRFFGDLQEEARYGKAVSSPTRLVVGGDSLNGPNYHNLEFVTISTLGDAKDFGDLITCISGPGGCASPTRGIFAGGAHPADVDSIEYITFSSRGNAIDFGNLTTTKHYYGSGTSSSTRGIFAAGEKYSPQTYRTEIDYITIATTGNAADFGDVTQSRGQTSDFSDSAGGLG